MGFKALKEKRTGIDNFQVFLNGMPTEKIFPKKATQGMITIWKCFDKYAQKHGYTKNVITINKYYWENENEDILELKLIKNNLIKQCL